MTILASDIMDRSASVFLNDASKNLYSYTTQLPFLTEANEQLGKIAAINEFPIEKTQAATIVLASGSTTYTPLPNDLVVPIRVWERDANSNNSWEPLDKLDFAPGNVTQGSWLQWWWWSNQAINFVGANQSRDVRLDYIRLLLSISTSSSPAELQGCTSYLAIKTAELCARFIGQNKELADDLLLKVAEAKDELVRIAVKNNQGVRTRRKSYRLANRSIIISG